MLNKAQHLADTGQDAGLLELLSGSPPQDLQRSPTLALLFGIAHGRLGRSVEAERWVQAALQRARDRGDRAVEAHALNALGVIALDAGRIDDAAGRFMEALALAKREGDHATVGRSCNNLGIVAYYRGDYGRAVGSYTMALAAFQQADLHAGIAQVLNNLAITYRDQGELDRALEAADSAVQEADEAGDIRLGASTRGGRAEIRLVAGDPEVARREIERSLQTQREIGSVVGEAEDLRVLAGALAAAREIAQAETMLRDVVHRAEELGRPVLAAQAERDLARVLNADGRASEKLDQFLAESDA
jgi:tetratricopeptide (TPR) repeat protein